MKLLRTLLVFFLLPIHSSLFANELDELFTSSLSDAKSDQTESAISKFEKWLVESGKNNSPQVHHNLAALYARKSDFVNTSKELAQATALFSSPIARMGELDHLLNVQRNLGIQHSTLEQNHLLALLLVSKDALGVLGLSALWFYFLYFYFQFSRRRTYKPFPLMGGFCLLSIAILWTLLVNFGSIGVLSGSQEVAVYSSSEMKEKIVSLPPGTIVRVRKTLQTNHQILEPVYGWIKSNDCLLTALPTSFGS